MTDVNQVSFNAGEMSPQVVGRTDLAKWFNGLRLMQNFIPLLHGPAMRRSGLGFIAETKASENRSRLLEFKFSETQSYALEFGAGYVRFFRDGGAITTEKIIAGATKETQCLLNIFGHGFGVGDLLPISEVGGMTELNGNTYRVVASFTDAVRIDVDSTTFGTYSGGGVAEGPYTISSPYAEVDLPLIDTAQSGDVLYLAHSGYPPRTLTRFADNEWSLGLFRSVDGPYLPENITGITLTPSDTTGFVTIIASDDVFSATDVGRMLTIDSDSDFFTQLLVPPYGWTESGKGTDEWYVRNTGADPEIFNPSGFQVFASGEWFDVPRQSIGFLERYSWDYGDNDSLGYDTIYFRMNTLLSSKDPGSLVTPPRFAGAVSYSEGSRGAARITGYTSPQLVEVAVEPLLPFKSVSPSTVWALGAWRSE